MSEQMAQFDNAFLKTETENGRDRAYPMAVAADLALWSSFHNELSRCYSTQEVHDKSDLDLCRIELIVKFCQISFAHGEQIQNLATHAQIHKDLLWYTEINAKSAFNALSNLVTRNVDSAGIVLKQAAETLDALGPNVSKDLPISAILLLRNSLSLKEKAGHLERCLLVCKSSILLHTLCRSTLQERGIICLASEEDESLRLVLSIAIMDTLFDAGLVQQCIDLHLCIKDDQQLSIAVKNEVFKYIDQYCFQNKRHIDSNIEVVLATELAQQVPYLEQAILEKVEEPDLLHKNWIGTSLLLSSFSALVTHEDNVGLLQSDTVQGCVPSVIKVLGLAHQQFPRSRGGRQDDPSDSVQESTFALPNVKRDCITIISNLTHNNTNTQNQVRELGGIPLILAQCNIDDLNPYLREHAMYCIRNLLDENKANQELVDSIKPVGVQQTSELTDLGYRAELQNGKVGINRIPKIESINED